MRSGPKQKLKHGRRNTISLPLGGKCGGEQSSVIVPGFASAANQVPGFDRSVWGETPLAGGKRGGIHAGIRAEEERSNTVELQKDARPARTLLAGVIPGPRDSSLIRVAHFFRIKVRGKITRRERARRDPTERPRQPWHTICSSVGLPKRSCRRDACGPLLRVIRGLGCEGHTGGA